MADIEKIGVLIPRGDRILLCRKKRETSRLILPGGRIEPGESDRECLARETREELGAVALEQVEYLGTYEDRASMADRPRPDSRRGPLPLVPQRCVRGTRPPPGGSPGAAGGARSGNRLECDALL